MTKINISQTRFFKFLSISFVIFLFNVLCLAQNQADLEIKVQPASENARGGEIFSYTITIGNIGSAKATDVIFIQSENGMANFVSYVPGKGNCSVYDNERRGSRVLNCKLGDLEAGESVLTLVEVKIIDFGGESETNETDALRESIKSINRMTGGKSETDSKGTLIANMSVSAEQSDKNNENNSIPLYVKLLPSKNLPPRVQIITPKEEEIITRNSKKLTKVVFKIKAFDPDGIIEKVTVNTQQFSISMEYPENKFVIDGEKYSIKEVEDNKERFQKYFGGEAAKIDKDTYTFTLENPKYGLNVIFIEAVDDGKRVGIATVRLTVKGDNSIEFVTPVKDSIIKPNTDLTIETMSKLNDGSPTEFLLIAPALCCENHFMKQVSKNGNSYTHQYLWKNIPKGQYYVQVFLMEDTGAFTYSEGLEFKVTEKPTVKITSIKNGQIFNQGEDIPIEIAAEDSDGTIENVSVSVDDKYERDFSWRQGGYKKSGYISYLQKGTYKIKAKVADDLDVEVESEPITIIVK